MPVLVRALTDARGGIGFALFGAMGNATAEPRGSRVVVLAFVLATAGCGGQAQKPASGTALAGASVMPEDQRVADLTFADLIVTVTPPPRAPVISATLAGAKARFFLREDAREGEDDEPPTPEDVPSTLRDLLALQAERIEARAGEVMIVDARHALNPALWIDDIALSVEGLATRGSLMAARPALLTAHGRTAGSAPFDLVVTTDPFAREFTMAGWLVIRDLRATEFYEFLYAYLDVVATQGSLDVFLSFHVEGRKLTGAVKVLARAIEVEATQGGWAAMKAAGLDLATDLLADDPLGRDVLATVIPIEGTVGAPGVELGTTVLGLVYNGFVAGLRAGFTGVPPPRAEKRRGFLSRLGGVLFARQRPRASPGPPVGNGGTARVATAIKPGTFFRSEGIAALQTALMVRGWLTASHQTGHLDGPTRIALRRFQQREGLAATGLVDYATTERLGVPSGAVFHGARRRESSDVSRLP